MTRLTAGLAKRCRMRHVHVLDALCTSAQTVDSGGETIFLLPSEGPSTSPIHMLSIAGLVIVLIAVVILPRILVTVGVGAAPLGRMSERWLAEHRASQWP